MDSFMRYCKKTKVWTGLFYFALFAASLAWAASSSLNIKSVELIPADEVYLLNADFDLNLSPAVEEALNKGVSLNFLIEFQLHPRANTGLLMSCHSRDSVAISYHALSRQYLINRGKHQQSFTSLQEAKDAFSHLRGWRVVEKNLLKKDGIYHAALRVRLDQSKLPKPLQVDALGSEEWTLVSERYRWVPALVL